MLSSNWYSDLFWILILQFPIQKLEVGVFQHLDQVLNLDLYPWQNDQALCSPNHSNERRRRKEGIPSANRKWWLAMQEKAAVFFLLPPCPQPPQLPITCGPTVLGLLSQAICEARGSTGKGVRRKTPPVSYSTDSHHSRLLLAWLHGPSLPGMERGKG